MATLAVLAMGQMGSGIARRLHESGARVVTSLAGRSPASAARAKAAGVQALDDAEMVEEAQILLSIVPPGAAAATAERYLQAIANGANKPMFIDCNAIAPQTLHALSRPFLEQGLEFGDASIIGGPPRAGYCPKLYLSGPVAHAAETLSRLGLTTRVISPALGDASALKMAYGGVTKGLQAIGAAMSVGAARAGVADIFAAELQDSQPELFAWLCKAFPGMYAKAYRWDEEMVQISTFLEPELGAAEMLRGAARFYRRVAEEHQAGPTSEMIAVLDTFATRRPS